LDELDTIKREYSILYAQEEFRDKIPDDYIKVNGTPTLLRAAVLTPLRPFFANPKNRLIFAQRVNEALVGASFLEDGMFLAKNFYSQDKSITSPRSTESGELVYESEKPVIIFRMSSQVGPSFDGIYSIFEQILTDANIPFKTISEDKKDSNWIQKIQSNEEYDIRANMVDIGGYFKSWVIRMMFCSKLGISFPDPSGNICNLVDIFDSDDSTLSLDQFASRFNKALIDDASVLPLLHVGESWGFSSDLNLKNITPTMGMPRFDNLERK
jgi:hypothetical protein